MPTGIIPNTDIELNLLSGAHWSRTTIADGKWLNSNTIQPLFNNDCILASAIHDTSADLYNRLADASGELQDEIDDINYEIDVINAGSDVIDVVGSWADLQSYEGWTTDNDVIKVLNDEHSANNQTYYRYVDDTLTSGTMNPDPSKWQYVGDLAPYYSKTEIDGKITDINNTINNVSSTLHTEISNTSAILHQEILTSASELHQELVTTSGNIINVINNVSGDIIDYVDIASGNLHTEILTSATNLQNNIDYVSGQANYSAAYLYSLIHDTSGKTEVSGGKYVQVTKLPQKPDGMITYSADLNENQMVTLEASGEHLKIVNSGNTSTFVCDASQVLAAPDGVTVPIDLLIQPDRSGYDITGSGVSGFIPSIPPKTATGMERLVLGKEGGSSGSNFGWIESDLIKKTLRSTDGTIDSTTRQHELDFEILTYRNVPWNPLQVSVSTTDDSGNKTDYGKLIPPPPENPDELKEKYLEKSIRIDSNGRVDFTEDPINYLEHTQHQGDVRYHNVHLCGYYREATDPIFGYDKTVNGDAVGVSADNGFRYPGYSWMVWPVNNNEVEAGAYRKESDPAGSVEYVNDVQDFTQNGPSYTWSKKIPTLYVHVSRNSGSGGYRVNKLIELPKDPRNGTKYPKFVHGSGMFKVGSSREIHIIPGKAPYDGSDGYSHLNSIDYMQNYNCSGFVANEWNHISFDFSRTSAWSETEPNYESNLRYIAVKGRDNSDSEITVENLRLLCWY